MKMRVLSFFSSHRELIWFLGISVLMYCVSFMAIYRNFSRVPADRWYYGAEEYPLDMTGNLAYVQQGIHGAFVSSFNYSTHLGESPSFLKLEYVFLGHLARVLAMDPIVMFWISKIALSMLLLVVSTVFIRRAVSDSHTRILAYICSLFGASIVIPGFGSNFSDISVFDTLVFVRTSLLTHHYALGAITALLSLFALSKVFDRALSNKWFVIALISGFLTSVYYAPNTILVLLSAGVFVVGQGRLS